MSEIRWILLGLGLVLIVGIWWWGARRSAQAPAGAQLRQAEIVAPPPPPPAHTPAGPAPMRATGTEWGVSPLEPLSISTADFDDVPVLDLPLRVEQPAAAQAPPPPRAAPASTPKRAPARPETHRPETQKIVTLRVAAAPGTRWNGAELRTALEQQGLEHGRYQVFHRRHTDGSSLFCIANLVEPGTFDLAAMPGQEFRGISAFAVFPGSLDPLETLDALIGCVRGLAATLSGTAQDADGQPLSAQREMALREELGRFHGRQG